MQRNLDPVGSTINIGTSLCSRKRVAKVSKIVCKCLAGERYTISVVGFSYTNRNERFEFLFFSKEIPR